MPFFTKAQTTDINQQIKKAKAFQYTGIALTAGGAIVSIIGMNKLSTDYKNDVNGSYFAGSNRTANIDKDKNYIYAGAALSAIGIVFDILSIHHIGKLKLKANGIAMSL